MRVVGTRSLGLAKRVIPALLVVLCLAALFTFGPSESASAQQSLGEASSRPNMIFIFADDLDSASAPLMPTIRSELIEKGISFDNAFISYPLCCPSRSTVLTGLYAHNHDVRGNKPPEGGFKKFVFEGHEEDTIATELQQSGYKTVLFGKYLNGYPGDDPTHVPPGWDEWYGKIDEQKLYDYRINENGQVVSYGNDTEDFYTDVLSGQVTDYIRREASDSSPFFMYVAPTAPHGPATPAERYKGAFAEQPPLRPPSFNEEDVSDKPSWIRETDPLSDQRISEIDDYYRQRLESMLAVDDMVGSLIRELEASGKLDNTFIFFTSDNGFQQGEHRIPTGKNRPYEESVRVPLFVRGPGVPAGAKTEDFIVNTDFAPTFADLGGASFSGDGRSFKPLLQGQNPPWRSAVLLERPSNNKQAFSAIRTENYKYVEYNNGEKELYDLQADPYELNSIPESANPSLFADLKTRLDVLKSCSGEECREAEDLYQSPLALPLPSSGGPSADLAASEEGLPPGKPSQFYLVQPGDALSEIADRFGSPVEAIAQANGIEDPNIILAGQRLVVPVGPSAYLPSSGGTAANPVYTTQVGDTLSGIANRFDTSVEAIAQANGLDNPNLIFLGQSLRIPTSSGP